MQKTYGSYLPVIQTLIGVCCVVAVLVGVLYRIRLNAAREVKSV